MKDLREDRRGLVGCVPLYHIAGAAAAQGKSLEEVAAIAQRFADNMATIAVATKGATHPATGMEIAHIEDGIMEVGMGQHGEGGGGSQPMKSADETAAIMLEALLKDLDVKAGEKLMVVINGSGSTTLMEQLIVFRAVHKLLAAKGIEIVANMVGEILTVQETARHCGKHGRRNRHGRFPSTAIKGVLYETVFIPRFAPFAQLRLDF